MEAHVPRAGSFASESRLRLSLLGDERLARLAGGGSERAFTVLYERYHQPLYRYCRSIVRNDVDAQDALQSALASAFAALRRSQRDAPLRPWLFRIAHNEAVSLLRQRRGVVELSEASEAVAQSVPERAGERERMRVLVADLAGLPERQRGALVMRELSGLSHEQIALALGTSVGGAKQAIFEARQALLDCEQGRAMECEEVLRSVSDTDRRALRSRRVRAHLRDCTDCAAFAAATRARRSDLHALAPLLAPAAAAALRARLLRAHSGHAGAGTVAAGSTGKSIGLALALKTAVAAAILTTATVGLARALTPPTRPVAPSTARPTAQMPPPARASFASHAAPTVGAAHRHAATHAVALAVRRQHAYRSTSGVLAPSPAHELKPPVHGGSGAPSTADALPTVSTPATTPPYTTSPHVHGSVEPGKAPAGLAQPNLDAPQSGGPGGAATNAPTRAIGPAAPDQGSTGATGVGAPSPADPVTAPAQGNTGTTGAGAGPPASPVNTPPHASTGSAGAAPPASPRNHSPLNTPPHGSTGSNGTVTSTDATATADQPQQPGTPRRAH